MSDWISVEDRLPEKDERVLVWLPENEQTLDDGIFDIAYFEIKEDEEPVWRIENGPGIYSLSSNDVTHWMPLPGPPNEKT
jgi:hypothetical protein